MNTSVKRWVPFASVPLVAVAAAIAIPLSTNAAQDLPEKTPEELLTFVAQSDVRAFSGEFTQTSDLGLPDLSALGGSGTGATSDDSSIAAAIMELATASHDGRVYVDADNGARLQVLDRLGERDVIATEDDGLWVYDSGEKSAIHITATGDVPDSPTLPPADVPTPSSVAEDLLASLDGTTTVAVGSTATVAGRSAYELLLTPRDDASLVDSITVSIDGETGLPLGLAVTADGSSSPAISVAYTSIDFSTPDADLFSFTPPSGVEVTEKTSPANEHSDPATPEPGTGLPGATTSGSGWTTIVELPAGDASAFEGLDAVTTAVDGGRVLSSSLVNVLFTDDGRVLAGAVSIDALEAAAR
ncbi:outer membrane lipoprotein carrier protein LolA [Labedella phragmitis]|uniref:Outer membrane lipoprotein carrier protein LolA n=1 Tax=Labedella phragmitis TaxID=2498849 RepID=A0A444PUE2_9MICO|nr:outer membrane lipoprotein carrier protein LolA [Labedella phragmitis]RWZ51490.1 outer membrane lipoprotein carrier protein LolA [Labedella phragmitis]